MSYSMVATGQGDTDGLEYVYYQDDVEAVPYENHEDLKDAS